MSADVPARHPETHTKLALMAAAATGVQVGAAMVATRLVVDQAGRASLPLLRYAIGFLRLLPAVLTMAPRVRFAARDLEDARRTLLTYAPNLWEELHGLDSIDEHCIEERFADGYS